MPKLTVVPNDVTVDVAADETILEALYRQGYAYRIGCRRGGCAICKVDLLEGEVMYNRPIADKVLTDDERDEGICLSCRAVPTTDIVISLREDSLRTVNPMMAMFAAQKSTG